MIKGSHGVNVFWVIIFTMAVLILLTEPALAGPGGKIARSLVDSFPQCTVTRTSIPHWIRPKRQHAAATGAMQTRLMKR